MSETERNGIKVVVTETDENWWRVQIGNATPWGVHKDDAKTPEEAIDYVFARRNVNSTDKVID